MKAPEFLDIFVYFWGDSCARLDLFTLVTYSVFYAQQLILVVNCYLIDKLYIVVWLIGGKQFFPQNNKTISHFTTLC